MDKKWRANDMHTVQYIFVDLADDILKQLSPFDILVFHY